MTDKKDNPAALAKAHGGSDDVLADASDTTEKTDFGQVLPTCSDKSNLPDAVKKLDIKAAEFLDTMFADINPATEVVCVSKGFETDDGMGFWNLSDEDPVFAKWKPEKQRVAWYACCSSVNGEKNAKGNAVLRKTANVVKYHFMMLDDIGSSDNSKATPPPVAPTAKIETSKENFQWFYALIPGDDFKRFEALLEFCHEQGHGDGGAGGCYRICRIPGSTNIKKGRDNFKSVVTYWEPDRVWTLDELAVALGCTDLDLRAAKQTGKRVKQSATTSLDIDSIDPLYVWLNENGHIIKDDGGDFVEVRCPNYDEHTAGSETGGYSPLGRGDNEFAQTRGWKCLHEHCRDWHFKDFNKAMAELGAPRVSGFDPLPWLQHRYTYIVVGSKIADLVQRLLGGVWLYDYEDWGKMHKGRIMVPGREQPIEMKTAFLEHKRTKKVTTTQYWPVKADEDMAIVVQSNQELVNTYVPPNHPHTTKEPDVFLDHIDFLLADDTERDLFLDWLAYKVQNPHRRSYAVIMIAEDGFGVGRSWLRAMMQKVLQGKVQTATLPQLIGKGTSAEKNYNDWAAECQLLVVEEAKDNITKEDFYNGYETFKQRVDTRVSPVRVNPKYGRTRDDWMFFNALIFSNHSDALAIPANDRRICVLTNPSVMADAAYYDRLEGGLNDKEAQKIYWYLMERDISNYDHVYPIDTEGKRRMTDQNVIPSEAIKNHILDICTGDIFTKKMLKSRVITAAAALDYDGILKSPGPVIRPLWGKMGKLRNEKNGARYLIEGDHVEVRAMRNIKKWKDMDANRARDEFTAELLKNDKTGGKGLKHLK
jgi:hypothetical protein